MSRIVCFADVDVAELYLGCCAVPHPLSGGDRSLSKGISCVEYSKTEKLKPARFLIVCCSRSGGIARNPLLGHSLTWYKKDTAN